MANANRGLGKGLGALLGDAALRTDTSDNLYLPISQIEPYANQPRRHFDEEALQDLADSIREHGIIQPLTVRRLSSGYYQIIAGERRWRAARIAGLAEVPAIVIEADDRKMTELSLIENLQREDLDPIEEAEGYRVLTEQYGMTQDECAQRVGKSRPTVANALRLLGLTEPVRAMVEDGRLSAGHARALLTLGSKQQQAAAVNLLYFLPTAAMGVIAHKRNGLLETEVLKSAIPWGTTAAAAGALAATAVDTAVLRRLFGAYLLLAAAGSLRQLWRERRRK